MKKYLVALFALLLVIGCATTAPVTKKELNAGEKRYMVLRLACSNAGYSVPAIRGVVNIIFDDPKQMKEISGKLNLMDKKMSHACAAVEAKKDQARSAGENFLSAEMAEFQSIADDLAKWETLKKRSFTRLDFEKNSAQVAKVVVFIVSMMEDGVKQTIELFNLIENPAHQEEINGLKAVLDGVRPSIRLIIAQAKELEKKKVTPEEMENEYEKIAVKLVPVQTILGGVMARFTAMYFEGFSDKDFGNIFRQ